MDIIIPSLGETVDEGKVIKWMKKVGDEIKEGDVLCEVETDKATADKKRQNYLKRHSKEPKRKADGSYSNSALADLILW